RKRLRDIGDVWELLDNEKLVAPMPLVRRRNWLWPSLTAVSIVALGWLGSIHFREKPSLMKPVRFSIPLPDKAGFAAWIAVSPDGRKIAFTSNASGTTRRVWIRSMESTDIKSISGTDGTTTAFWSPDSRFLVFQSDGKLKKVETETGLIQT